MAQSHFCRALAEVPAQSRSIALRRLLQLGETWCIISNQSCQVRYYPVPSQHIAANKLSCFELGIAEMAAFCQKCVDERLDFAKEAYKIFEHPQRTGNSDRMREKAPEHEVYIAMLVGTY
jgi:hypothetical protein